MPDGWFLAFAQPLAFLVHEVSRHRNRRAIEHIDQLPVDQRAKFLSKQLKGMDKAQKEKAILNYAKKRILTEAVAAQMAEDLQ